jgi:voltage-gated potassium channel Kch
MSLLARLVPYPVQDPAQGDRQHAADHNGPTDRGWSVGKGWQWFRGMLAYYHWWILAFAWLAAFALGCIGWWRFSHLNAHIPSDYSYAAYMSFKDFLMNSPGQQSIPWELHISRFLAPGVAGWATLSALGLLFRDRMQQMRIPFMHGHVVMCGLGKYVGIAFLRDLREKRIPVVVIESDATNPNIELCRSLGAPVVLGDAQRKRTLQAAGAHRASRVLVVSPDDAVNTQIAATWRELPKRRSHQAGCLARISEPEFSLLLWIQELQRGGPELSVDFFNIDEISARLMLEKYPIDTDRDKPHILVAHLDPLGEWLVYHAARAWHDNRDDKTVPLVITVLDDKPQERIAALLGRHEALGDVCMCKFNPLPATTKDIGELAKAVTPPLSGAYVTAYRDHQALQTALKLRHALGSDIPVVVALSRPHGVAGLLDDVMKANKTGALVNIKVFSTMERACTAELVQGGSFELMARAIHEQWREDQRKAGKPPTTWEELDYSRKQSSRAQARDIPNKLRMVGCAITPLRKWDATDFTFTEQEVKLLAIEEHDRWNDERVADGWTLDLSLKKADPVQKRNPYLVPWQELPPDIAQYDADFVEAIPRILASAGMQVVRTTELTQKVSDAST